MWNTPFSNFQIAALITNQNTVLNVHSIPHKSQTNNNSGFWLCNVKTNVWSASNSEKKLKTICHKTIAAGRIGLTTLNDIFEQIRSLINKLNKNLGSQLAA